MRRSVRGLRGESPAAAIDMAPLIDVVFMLLLFFMVTTTFSRDEGIDVVRPAASHAQPLASEAVRVHLTAAGRVYLAGAPVSLEELGEHVQEALRADSARRVVVVPDARTTAGDLVEVIDRLKAAGAGEVAVATRAPGAP